MLRTVVLHGTLARFGESFELDVKSPVEAVRALIVQIKGFRQALREGEYRILKGDDALSLDELRLRLGRATEIHLVPVIAGSAAGWEKILAGVAIIGLAIAAPYALGFVGGVAGALAVAIPGTFGLATFGTIASLGAAMALGGVAQMLSPTSTSTPADNKQSFLFGSVANVSKQGVPVPLVFGEFVTGSVVISVGLTTEDHASLLTGVFLNDVFYPNDSLGHTQSLFRANIGPAG